VGFLEKNAGLMKVVVVGGGAAGFFGAITCIQTHPHTQVLLLEAGRQLLAKLRISGGGRCNVTHACFEPAALIQAYPRGAKALRGALSRFQPRDTVNWFESRGVKLKTEADGRMFPVTDDSATIADCLITTARASGVEIRTGDPVIGVTHPDSGFSVHLKSGEVIECDRLLLATGSSSQGYGIAKGLGHSIIPPVPSLFTFQIPDSRLQDLAGIAIDPVQLDLQIPGQKPLTQTGPCLVTHWGLSGPAVLKLSAWGARVLHDHHYQAQLQINWLPQKKLESWKQELLATKVEYSRRAIGRHCPVPLPRRLWERLTQSAGITPEQRWAELSHKTLHLLLSELCQGNYRIQGKGAFKEEFVTCGGVNLREVDFKTMSSRCCPGLYFAGEVLDIDGITGGFNFQSAWTTAWLAGQAIGAAK
jgi:hypothetical protein